MRQRDRRYKASDVFRESQFLFGDKVRFEEAYPEIEDVTIEVERSGEGVNELNRNARYTKQTLPGQYIDCTNPLCYNGGFSIGSVLRQMVMEKKTQSETTSRCQGYEGSPKGRRRYRDCTNFFSVRVHLSYKDIEKAGS
jgi:hypothetical protein